MRVDCQRSRAVTARDLLDANDIAEGIHARAAILLGDANAQEPHFCEFRYELDGKTLFGIPALCAGGDFGARKLSNALAQQRMLLVKFKVHRPGRPKRTGPVATLSARGPGRTSSPQ